MEKILREYYVCRLDPVFDPSLYPVNRQRVTVVGDLWKTDNNKLQLRIGVAVRRKCDAPDDATGVLFAREMAIKNPFRIIQFPLVPDAKNYYQPTIQALLQLFKTTVEDNISQDLICLALESNNKVTPLNDLVGVFYKSMTAVDVMSRIHVFETTAQLAINKRNAARAQKRNSLRLLFSDVGSIHTGSDPIEVTI